MESAGGPTLLPAASSATASAGSRMRLLFRLVLFLAALLVVAGTGLALFALEGEPLIARTGRMDFRDLQNARALAERFDPRGMPPRRVTIVRARAGELNTLIRGALAGVPRAAGRVAVTRYGVVAAVTVETPLPSSPLGRFFNLRATVAPSRSRLVISRLALGRLEIPPGLVRPALRLALDGWLGAGRGGPALDSIRGVWIERGVVAVTFRPPPGLAGNRKEAGNRRIVAEIDRRTARVPLFRPARRR